MLTLYNQTINSRLLLGTARYPSIECLKQCITRSKTEIITLSLRKENIKKDPQVPDFLSFISKMPLHLLPNTSGCFTAKEAIMTAQMARELLNTTWIKLEIIHNMDNLAPNNLALIEATKELINQGFHIFPYTTDDLSICDKLLSLGCEILMPLGSPIGSGMGLNNIHTLQTLRSTFPQATLIIDAGIGKPSDACSAMELGFNGILLNTAIAEAGSPPDMAEAFSTAINAGHLAYQSHPMPKRNYAQPSSPIENIAFQIK